jgi:hypothetical protein
MRSRFHASYPALLLTLTHFGCSGEMGGPGEAVATESSALSSNISWTSSAMLVDPASAAWASVKDPTVVYTPSALSWTLFFNKAGRSHAPKSITALVGRHGFRHSKPTWVA